MLIFVDRISFNVLRSLIGPSPGDQYVRSSKGAQRPWNSNEKTSEKTPEKPTEICGLVVMIFNVFCFLVLLDFDTYKNKAFNGW